MNTINRLLLLSLISTILFTCNSPAPNPEVSSAPAGTWPSSSMEEEGMDQTPFDSITLKIENGDYGNIDKLLIIKNGKMVLNKSYSNDYREISKGFSGYLGCGIDACQDSSELNDYN